MTQCDLNTAVAQATGEELREIRRRGFSVVDLSETRFDPEPDILTPQMVDWDDLDLRRNVPVVQQTRRSLPRTA
ncbi:hypothetical protein SH661x_002902 [Planctomicrobium sp. SH661]|uniref:hypothetical protein n=1 Tax=Planctomicrobium sp. SH661 TaxID=3448124 RepID=UPI003F5BC1D6